MPACATGRFIDLGLKVYDTQTNLEWEKKAAGGGCLHCVNDVYTWVDATGTWVTQVNQEGFAGHRDWRVPTLAELQTVVDCSSGAPCIDPIFGPTASAFYWSATENGPDEAFFVSFADGSVIVDLKGFGSRVRAGRGGP